MTIEQLTVIAKLLLTLAAGVMVTWGWINNNEASELVAALVTVATVGWAAYTRRVAGLVRSAARYTYIAHREQRRLGVRKPIISEVSPWAGDASSGAPRDDN